MQLEPNSDKYPYFLYTIMMMKLKIGQLVWLYILPQNRF